MRTLLVTCVDARIRPAMMDWIDLLARFKDVGIVHLVSHEHCPAYERKLGGYFNNERELLERDLRAARRTIEDAVYGVRVECHLVPWVADLPGGGEYAAAMLVG